MPYWPIGLWFFAVALSMGCIMGPATSSVMGAVPKEKADVASAMSEVTRQVGGSLGTAIIGLLVASFYSSRIADAASGLPSGAHDAVKDSIGTADAVAAQLPADQGSSRAAFVAAVIVIRRLPARAAEEPQRGATVEVALQAGSAS
jgi:MFS transporter, DHA2 family, multidrug resistance protein